MNYKDKQNCVLCGFDKKFSELHHIIRRQDYGSNSDENLVFLCPNHHKLADSPEHETEIKDLIFEKTGKKGEILSEEKIHKIEEFIYLNTGAKKESWAFQNLKNSLLSSIGFLERLNRGVIR